MKINLFRNLIFVALLVATFQNCSKGLQSRTDEEASTFLQTQNCMNSQSDACLFNKNAVSQTGKAVTADRIGGYQLTATQVLGRDNSGFLQNAHFSVLTSQTERITSTQGFKHYYNTQSSALEQVMSYTHTQKLWQWLNDRGFTIMNNKGIKIYADAGTTTWVPSRNEIHLQRETQNFPAALDASLIMHLYAQAAIWHASAGQSQANLNLKAQACADQMGFMHPFGCCTSSLGCAPAIVSGAADVMTSFQFLSKPALGDGLKNDPKGLSVCGLARNPASNRQLTISAASQRCSGRGSTSQIHALGLVYASIWFEAREKAQNKYDFEKFFLKHLSLIRGDDDFLTLKSKILTLDTNEFSGYFGSIMNDEFTRRGL
jgi:hypothetical protein